MKDKVCKSCKRFVEGNICPACKGTEFTRNWKGSVIIFDAGGEVAKLMSITAPGKYAIEVKQ